MKNRPGLKQYIFAALGVVILVLLDQYTKLLAIAHLNCIILKTEELHLVFFRTSDGSLSS